MSNKKEPLTPAQLRERADVTQRRISVVLDVTVGTVQRWEKEEKIPHLTLKEIVLLRNALKANTNELNESYKTIAVRITLNDLLRFLKEVGWTLDQLAEFIGESEQPPKAP